MAASMCRVCLGGNIRLVPVRNSKLIEIYQKLTSAKLNSDGSTDRLCYICHTQLLRCCRFADMALQSEVHLRELIRNGNKMKQKTSTLLDHSLTHNISTRPVQFLTLSDEEEVTVKIEHEDTMGFHFLEIDETKTNNFDTESNEDPKEINEIERICDFVDVKFDNSDDEYYSDTKFDKKKPNSDPSYVYCDFCNKRFSYKYRLMVHLRTHTNKPKRFKCSKCDEAFMHLSTLKFHIKTHEVTTESFSCKICSETFATKVKLTSHILSHTGEWQFKCDKCQKAFTKSADLKRHATQAHAPNSFSCSVCNKEFNKSVSFKAHMSTHTAKRIHICHICDKSFSVPANLKRHVLTHTEQRPTFPCLKCSKVYTHKHHLRDHLRTHNGERPYACKICDKAFSYASTLRNHMVIHTGEKPFVCHKCHSPFSQSSTLTRHLRLIHDVK